MQSENRLTRLEETCWFQESQLEKLDRQILDQQKQLDSLEAQLRELRNMVTRLKEFAQDMTQPQAPVHDDPPPHYQLHMSEYKQGKEFAG